MIPLPWEYDSHALGTSFPRLGNKAPPDMASGQASDTPRPHPAGTDARIAPASGKPRRNVPDESTAKKAPSPTFLSDKPLCFTQFLVLLQATKQNL